MCKVNLLDFTTIVMYWTMHRVCMIERNLRHFTPLNGLKYLV